MSLKKKIVALSKGAWNFFRQWQEIAWAGICATSLVFFFHVFKSVDPSLAVDAIPALYFILLKVMKGIIIVFNAWLCKKVYTNDLSCEQEEDLYKKSLEGDVHAQSIVLRDRIAWAAWILFWFAVLSLPLSFV